MIGEQTVVESGSNAFTLFVTVGSTSFDELVSSVTAETTLACLASLGFATIAIQYGTGLALDEETVYRFNENGGGSVHHRNLTVRAFRYVPSLKEEYARASVVLCHGGSGTVFEASSACPGRVIVVPNRKLMDDHQKELAGELRDLNLIKVADATQPETILTEIAAVLDELKVRSKSADRRSTVDDVAPRNTLAIAAIIAEELM